MTFWTFSRWIWVLGLMACSINSTDVRPNQQAPGLEEHIEYTVNPNTHFQGHCTVSCTQKVSPYAQYPQLAVCNGSMEVSGTGGTEDAACENASNEGRSQLARNNCYVDCRTVSIR